VAKRVSIGLITCGLILGLGALLFTANDDTDRLQNQTVKQAQNDAPTRHPRFELKQKQALVDQDVRLTGELCKQQCSADLRQALPQLNHARKEDAAKQLQAIRKEHPHMIRLSWRNGQGEDVRSGELSDQVQTALSAELQEAEAALRAGKTYQQSALVVGDDRYLVLSIPNEHSGGIIGVVNQSILNDVTTHQKNNLRIVPYPPEGKYKIESVDSDTHRDIHVDSGEENGGASHYHKQQVVVKFKSPPSSEQWKVIKRELLVLSVRQLGYTYVIESNEKTAEQMLEYFNSSHDVQYAEPHYQYMTNDVPNDYLFKSYQWNLPITQTIEGWEISKGSDEIIIGVLDTGVDLDHPDLVGRLSDGINIINPDFQPMDDVGHGTHVAGVITALVNNEEGIAGMTWFDKVMPVKVLDAEGAGSTYSVAEGLIWAADHGAKVINMSLGNYADAEFLHDAIRYAFDQDVVLIAATGNDNTSDPGFPAAYPEVFAVSATDEQSQRAPFSNYGDYIDVVAPGVSIASTYPHNQYAALSGTSMASPHVSALAALIRSVNPSLANTEVMDIMRNTAIDLGEQGKDPLFGYGHIDVAAALLAAEQSKITGKQQTPIKPVPSSTIERSADTENRSSLDGTTIVDSEILKHFSNWFKRELERIHAKRMSL
jgi:thermitase